ncbi:hypothetical protein [Peribacillus muralis]|uniref:hypothetical protein n=1 Tax=Peribacillus muralis TaxID=264697 RepID=UPI003D022FA3
MVKAKKDIGKSLKQIEYGMLYIIVIIVLTILINAAIIFWIAVLMKIYKYTYDEAAINFIIITISFFAARKLLKKCSKPKKNH